MLIPLVDRDASIYVPVKRLKGKSYRDAQEAAKKKQPVMEEETTSSTTGPSKAKPMNGKVMEVLVPAVPKRTSSPSTRASSPPSSIVEDEESDAPRPKRNGAARKVIEISDDEDEVSPPPKKNGKAKAKPKKRASKSDASDYEQSGSEQSEEDASEVVSDEEDIPKPKKTKAKAKPKAVKKKSGSSDAAPSSDDAMDVDDAPSSSKAKGKGKAASSKKRKSMEPSSDEEEVKRPAKKRRHDTDPWKLKSAAVRRDWTQMCSPPLEMFHFARKVIDEYTYLEGKVHSMVTKLSADRQWVLSGTPPIHNFSELKTIATFIGVHLGVYDDGEGSAQSQKKAKKEQTGKPPPRYVSTSLIGCHSRGEVPLLPRSA